MIFSLSYFSTIHLTLPNTTATNYYAAPATVNNDGVLIAHSHVTVEVIDDFKTKKLTDPNSFAFFKGLNLAAEQGILSADVPGGLASASYRMCSVCSFLILTPILF